jgi:predicted nicotinamide N-methyase
MELQVDGQPRQLRVLQSWHAKDVPPGLGTCVWEASIALVRAFEQNPHWVAGKAVLELGCGPGLVAVACAALGAKRVVATDKAAAALALARANAAANAGGSCAVEVQRYAWGVGTEAAALGTGAFELVVGADIMYDATAPYPALGADLARLLAPGGRLALGYTKRPEFDPELVFRPLVAQGFQLEDEEEAVLRPDDVPADEVARWAPHGVCITHAFNVDGGARGGARDGIFPRPDLFYMESRYRIFCPEHDRTI